MRTFLVGASPAAGNCKFKHPNQKPHDNLNTRSNTVEHTRDD